MKTISNRPRTSARRRPIYPLVKADTVNPSASAVVERYAYDGFGRELPLLSSQVSGLSSGLNAFRFSTKQLDAETGMNYYGYRFYAADGGRWINRDPIVEKGGWNVYAMVENDAVMLWDLNGLLVGDDTECVTGACKGKTTFKITKSGTSAKWKKGDAKGKQDAINALIGAAGKNLDCTGTCKSGLTCKPGLTLDGSQNGTPLGGSNLKLGDDDVYEWYVITVDNGKSGGGETPIQDFMATAACGCKK